MGEDAKENIEPKSSFSFGLADEFKAKTDQDLTFLQEKFQLIKDLNPDQLTQFEKDCQMLEAAYGAPISFQIQEYWNTRLEKLAEERQAAAEAAKPKLKNPLSFKAENGTEIEVQPHVKFGKGFKLEELGLKIKGKFDWQKIHVREPKAERPPKIHWDKIEAGPERIPSDLLKPEVTKVKGF
jgi:hypothetical protein